MRASSRHDGAFSSRDKVGCDIRSRPVSGKRPQASLNAGSKQHVEVVAILVAASDGEHARPDHVGVAVGRARRIARVGQATGKARGKTEPFLDPAQQQHAAVGRQPAAVETGAQLLACYG